MFSQNDFTKFSYKLKIIILAEMCIDVLTSFKDLSKKHQRIVNDKINIYIKLLPEDFESKINNDFDQICCEEMFENIQTRAATMIVLQCNDDI